jgi:hypothetical protein
VVDSLMIGAVGVSGIDASDGGREDENCAVAGLKSAFGEHVIVPVYKVAGAGGAGEGR